MEKLKRTIDQIAEQVSASLPGEVAGEVRHNLRAALVALFERMELVTREELEIQEQVLLRTRERLESLEAQVAELERKLSNSS
jgi:BMFP domain-containing protein YqiC